MKISSKSQHRQHTIEIQLKFLENVKIENKYRNSEKFVETSKF